MENIKDTLAKYEKVMRDKVIDFRLSSLADTTLEPNTINTLSYYTSMFSKADTCDLETNNPVIYGVAMKQFIESTHATWLKYVVQDIETRTFDDAVNEGLSGSFHDFRDHFVQYTQDNIDKILNESDKEE
jgi:hypothetical protein